MIVIVNEIIVYCCRFGKSCYLVYVSSMRWSKREGSLDRLAGIYRMDLTSLIYVSASDNYRYTVLYIYVYMVPALGKVHWVTSCLICLFCLFCFW